MGLASKPMHLGSASHAAAQAFGSLAAVYGAVGQCRDQIGDAFDAIWSAVLVRMVHVICKTVELWAPGSEHSSTSHGSQGCGHSTGALRFRGSGDARCVALSARPATAVVAEPTTAEGRGLHRGPQPLYCTCRWSTTGPTFRAFLRVHGVGEDGDKEQQGEPVELHYVEMNWAAPRDRDGCTSCGIIDATSIGDRSIGNG